MIFLGLLIVVGIYLLTILTIGELALFWDFQAFGILAAGVMFHIAWFGRQFFLPGMKTIFRLPRPERGEINPLLGKYYWRLTDFTLALATLVAFIGLMMALVDLVPNNIGPPLAIGLLTLTYAILISLTVFMPISLRHLPDSVEPKRFPINLTLSGFLMYFITRGMMVAVLAVIIVQQDVGMLINRTFFTLFPTDMEVYEGLFRYNLMAFWDPASVVFLGVLLCGFRLASGRIHNRWTWTPICILYGVLGTITGMILMFGAFEAEFYPIGGMAALLSAFYGMVAAILFAIRSKRVTVLFFLGYFIATMLQGLVFLRNPNTPREALLTAIIILVFAIFLFLYILWGGIKKTRMSRCADSQSLSPLTPEEKQAQLILDKAVEQEKMENSRR